MILIWNRIARQITQIVVIKLKNYISSYLTRPPGDTQSRNFVFTNSRTERKIWISRKSARKQIISGILVFLFSFHELSYSFVDSSEDPMPIIRQVNYSTGFSSTNLQGIFCK